MKEAIILRFGGAWLALIIACTMNVQANDEQPEGRGSPPSGVRGGGARPAPQAQGEQPRPAPPPQVQRERPRPSPNVAPPPPAQQREEARPTNRRTPTPNRPVTAPPSATPRTQPGVRAPRQTPGMATQPGRPLGATSPAPGVATPTPPRGTEQGARAAQPSRQAPSDRVMTQRRVPPGEVSRQNDGSYSVRTRTGNQYAVRSNGSVRSFQSQQGEAQFRTDGTVRTVRASDFTIKHRPIGRDVMLRERPDHTVIASFGGGRGYIQRPFSTHGHDFVQRTYYQGRRPFPRFYRPYQYHGFSLYWYVPIHYYPPIFYNWAYAPWPVGAYLHWGWLSASWYGYYGPYFTPYGVYPAGPFWLTDYLLAWALEQDYRDRIEAAQEEAAQFVPPTGPGQVPLSAEVKQAIADEVRLQLSQMGLDSQSIVRNDIPRPGNLESLLTDSKPHVFVVASPLDVTSGTGECVLTPGDVLQTAGAPAANEQAGYMRVVSSKAGDCARGSLVAVSLYDLQGMLNRMRETIDQGLGELRSKQGQEGLPPAPPAALRGDIDAPFASAAPALDANGGALLDQTETEARMAEQSVLDQAFAETEAAPPVSGTIRLGQTIREVTAILGPPNVVVDMGSKKMYVYPGLKVTFTAGHVGILIFALTSMGARQNGRDDHGPLRPTPIGAGQEMYLSYCALYHGRDGTGSGPVSPALKSRTTDLTLLAKRNDGKFPAERVRETIRGDLLVVAHGTQDMPVWGPLFSYLGSGTHAEITVRIDKLTRYIESLQKTTP